MNVYVSEFKGRETGKIIPYLPSQDGVGPFLQELCVENTNVENCRRNRETPVNRRNFVLSSTVTTVIVGVTLDRYTPKECLRTRVQYPGLVGD